MRKLHLHLIALVLLLSWLFLGLNSRLDLSSGLSVILSRLIHGLSLSFSPRLGLRFLLLLGLMSMLCLSHILNLILVVLLLDSTNGSLLLGLMRVSKAADDELGAVAPLGIEDVEWPWVLVILLEAMNAAD
jgi:hypothetical protein